MSLTPEQRAIIQDYSMLRRLILSKFIYHASDLLIPIFDDRDSEDQKTLTKAQTALSEVSALSDLQLTKEEYHIQSEASKNPEILEDIHEKTQALLNAGKKGA